MSANLVARTSVMSACSLRLKVLLVYLSCDVVEEEGNLT